MSLFWRELKKELQQPKFWNLTLRYAAGLTVMGYIFPYILDALAKEGVRTKDKNLTHIANFVKILSYAFAVIVAAVGIYNCSLMYKRVMMRCRIIRGIENSQRWTQRQLQQRMAPQRTIRQQPQPLDQQVANEPEPEGERTPSTIEPPSPTQSSESSNPDVESNPDVDDNSEVESHHSEVVSLVKSSSAIELPTYELQIEQQTTPQRRSRRLLEKSLSQSSRL